MSDPMFRPIGAAGSTVVSTGELPAHAEVSALVTEAHRRFQNVSEGEVADYIPALAETDADLFGMCVVGVDGFTFDAGDSRHEFSIQSISKVFVFALLCQMIGHERARDLLGVNATGLPFNSVVAVELNELRTMNAMVNAGAIAATSLLPAASAAERWQLISGSLSAFAGRRLSIDPDVYRSESANNRRNLGIAHLLAGYGRIRGDPVEVTDLYTLQCSLRASAHDLAVMGATLADGGVNPITGERVVDASICKHVLAVMATAGLYDRSGDWLYEIGLPGKSGVSGGILTVAPGKGGLGTFSPRLDRAGNSVRGQLATKYLSEQLGLNLFASAPAPAPDVQPM